MKKGQTKRNRAFRVKKKPLQAFRVEHDYIVGTRYIPYHKRILRGAATDMYKYQMALLGTPDPDEAFLDINHREYLKMLWPTLKMGEKVLGKAIIVGIGSSLTPDAYYDAWVNGNPADLKLFTPAKMGPSMMEQFAEIRANWKEPTKEEIQENIKRIYEKDSKRK